jgi:hypothetical protein
MEALIEILTNLFNFIAGLFAELIAWIESLVTSV